MDEYIKSQFSYCPLVWNCRRWIKNNVINRLHEPRFKIIYNDKCSTFEEVLEKDNFDTIYKRNLRFRATEIFEAVSP